MAAIKRWCRSGGEPVSARVFASDQIVTIASIASTSASAVGRMNSICSSLPSATRASAAASSSTFR